MFNSDPRPDRPPVVGRPLNVLFANTSLPIGGAETLQLQLVRHLDRNRFRPMICCLKDQGALGETLASEVPVYSQLIGHKFDVRIVERLARIMRVEAVDALITVGAGDKMFWGRIAAKRARVPVILAAIHSTGWPDVIGRMNRMLTPITDAFIAVAPSHGDHLVDQEGFPRRKVVVIPNGIDTDHFRFSAADRARIREEFSIPADAPCIGLVAALCPEKDHILFVETASRIAQKHPDCHFLLVGDGPQRPRIESHCNHLSMDHRVHLAGSRSDVAACLSAMDGFLLTSQMEANPVSILEAMSIGIPVVSTDVGSIREAIKNEENGYLARSEMPNNSPQRVAAGSKVPRWPSGWG